MSDNRTVLQVLTEEAVNATSSRYGWLLVVDGGHAVVAAAVGSAGAVGTEVPLDGFRGYALASGQPAGMSPSPDDTTSAGVAGHPGVPTSLLVAPSGDGRVLIEVADRRGDGGFTFEDIEAVSSYAAIAEAAVTDASAESGPEVASPSRLGAELAVLAETDVHRYREVAHVVELLLSSDR